MEDTDDMTIEEGDGEEGGSPADLVSKIKKLKAELVKTNTEKQEYLDGWQRAKADYVNIKKRSEEDRISLIKGATEELVSALLPALDSFDQAILAHQGDKEWLSGVKNTHAQIVKALESVGVSINSPEGEQFDPNIHEPVETVAVQDETMDNTVTKVHQKGYSLNGKLIRPARVAVGHYQK